MAHPPKAAENTGTHQNGERCLKKEGAALLYLSFLFILMYVIRVVCVLYKFVRLAIAVQ